MKPHQKQDRLSPRLEREDGADERRRPAKRRRRDPLRYEKSGLFTEYWDDKRGVWRLIRHFRDWDSMVRSRRSSLDTWDPRTIRIRYPGDGKWNLPPASVHCSRPRERPAPPPHPEPVNETFLRRVDEAIGHGRRVRLVYRDRRDEKSVRIVRPLRWVEGDRFTAFCELRAEERDFRVHRLLDCQTSQE